MTIFDANKGKPPYDDVLFLALLIVKTERVKQRQLKVERKYNIQHNYCSISSFTIDYYGWIWDNECAVTDDRSETPPAKCSKHKAGADLEQRME